MDRLVVYTVALGLPFDLKPVKAEAGVDFICLTDQTGLDPNGWNLRKISPILAGDIFRSSREPKICPHLHFPDYKRSLYVDTKVHFRKTASEFWEHLIREKIEVFGALEHSFRSSIKHEFRAVRRARLDFNSVLDEQIAHYEDQYPEFMEAKPIWGGVMARRHMDPACIAAMETWLSFVLRYSRRDQLSLPIALAQLDGAQKRLLKYRNRGSPYHRWPVTTMQNQLYRKVSDGAETVDTTDKTKDENTMKQEAVSSKPNLPKGNNRIIFGFDEAHQLCFAESTGHDKRVYVSHPKRLELYNRGIIRRMNKLFADYRLPKAIVRRGDLVVDVGANVGEMGYWLMRQGADYIGFEPDPAAFKALTLNVPNGKLFDVGLSNETGQAKFALDTANADSTLFGAESDGNAIDIKIDTLDAVLETLEPIERVRLLKVEAEGMEPEVLSGARVTLGKCDYVAVDAGPERGGENTVPQVLRLLYDAGFEVIDCFLRRGTFLLKRRDDR